MADLSKQHGSFANYLAQVEKEGGEDGLRKHISDQFGFMGKGTTVLFLLSVGLDLPKASAEWHARHDGMQRPAAK